MRGILNVGTTLEAIPASIFAAYSIGRLVTIHKYWPSISFSIVMPLDKSLDLVKRLVSTWPTPTFVIFS